MGFYQLQKRTKGGRGTSTERTQTPETLCSPFLITPLRILLFLYLFHICFLVEAAGTRSPSIRLEYRTSSLRRLVLPETEHSFLPPPVSLALDRGLHE